MINWIEIDQLYTQLDQIEQQIELEKQTVIPDGFTSEWIRKHEPYILTDLRRLQSLFPVS